MEYDFYKSADGVFSAQLSVEHQVFAIWLNEEVQNNKEIIASINTKIAQVHNQLEWQTTLIGKEYSLYISEESVQVKANNHGHQDTLNDEEMVEDWSAPEALEAIAPDNEHDDWQDQEDWTEADCGLEDFISMFNEWQIFVGYI